MLALEWITRQQGQREYEDNDGMFGFGSQLRRKRSRIEDRRSKIVVALFRSRMCLLDIFTGEVTIIQSSKYFTLDSGSGLKMKFM